MEATRLDPAHEAKQRNLRLGGGVLLAIGILLMVFGAYRMFSPAWTDRGNPSDGFMEGRTSIDEVGRRMSDQSRDVGFTMFSGFAIVACGMVCAAAGGFMLKLGYMGSVARYVAGEVAPVASDTLNYMGSNTREGIHDVAEAIASGIGDARQASGAAPSPSVGMEKACLHCGAVNSAASNFCGKCGRALAS